MSECRDILTQYYAAEWQSLVEQATRLLQGDRMTAEDVVQTTFLRLLTHLSSSAPRLFTETTIPALVQQTMRNLLRDLWRRRQYRQDYEHWLATAQPWRAHADDVFSLCSASQMTELVEHRLARMDSSVAQVLRMNIVEQKSVAEISQELDTKYKTVENRLQAGRRQLRSYMRSAV